MGITGIYTLTAGETISHLQQATVSSHCSQMEGTETWRQRLSCVNEALLNPQREKNMVGRGKDRSETSKGKLPSESKSGKLGLPDVEKGERHKTSDIGPLSLTHCLLLKPVNRKLPKR